MPILPPLLDDRTWKDIRDEALARVPIYTQEWTDLHEGDPGVALVELFAYMTEALIYRLNRVPDNSYLAFLNLLDLPPIPGEPARGIVQFGIGPKIATATVSKGATLKGGGVPFSALDSLTALPVELHAFVKVTAPMPRAGTDQWSYATAAWNQYQGRVKNDKEAPIFVSTQVYPPPDGQVLPLSMAVDGALWVAVTARKSDIKDDPQAVLSELRRVLGEQVLSIGVAPTDIEGQKCTACTASVDQGGNRAPTNTAATASSNGQSQGPCAPPSMLSSLRWEITAPRGTTGGGLIQLPILDLDKHEKPRYEHVALLSDSTENLRHAGAIKLQLPAADSLYTWKRVTVGNKTVPISYFPAAGDLPPVLDDGELESRVVFWLRALSATTSTQSIDKRPKINAALTFIGPNVVDVLQSSRQEREPLGLGSGQAGQQFKLQFSPVLAESLQLTVLESNAPVTWREVDSFDGMNERDSAFVLDRAMGTVTVGDGLQGRVLPPGAQVYASYQYGGGLAGNLPAGALTAIDKPESTLDPKANNPIPTAGGSETETVEQARRRVPMRLRHQDRAVTAEDFRELTLITPGASLGRAEVLPLYNPSTQKKDAAGVVTVLVIPAEDSSNPRAPQPDNNTRALVCAHLDKHRLITTELYVIGPKYRRMAVYVGVKVQNGYGIEDVRKWVCLALYQFLSPLPPFGPNGAGWPLGGLVARGAIEAAVLQVDGVAWVSELRIYELAGGTYKSVRSGGDSTDEDYINLDVTELPELVEIQVGDGKAPPTPDGPGPDPGGVSVPVPLPRSKC